MLDFPINIGNPEEIKIIDVAILIKELTNSKSNIIFKTSMNDDPPRRKPNIENAIKLLNWNPKISIKEGIEKYLNYRKNEVVK